MKTVVWKAGTAVLAGAVGWWRLEWEVAGLRTLAPLRESQDNIGDLEDLPEGLRQGWERFWRGEPPKVPLVGTPPPFFQRVYGLVENIPAGRVWTYRQVAHALGCPGGARAVGQAMRRNPWALFVPCHRVLRTDGGLAGYGGPDGIPLKRALLLYEGVSVLPGGRFLEGKDSMVS